MFSTGEGVKGNAGLRKRFEYRTRRGVRIFKQPKVKDGEVVGWSKNYILAVKWGGRQYSFTLSPEKRESGSLADKITSYLKSHDHTPEMVMQEFFSAKLAKKEQLAANSKREATVGDVIRTFEETYGRARASSKVAYAGALRRIAAFILGLKPLPRKGRSLAEREKWREKVEALPLKRITPGQLEAFKAHIIRGAKDEIERGRARTTCNGYLRNAGQFFSVRARKRYEGLGLEIPSNPFAEVEREEEPRHYYQSSVVMEEIVSSAGDELKENEASAYAAFVLAAFAGLSKSEMDKLLWDQVDLERREIIIRTTPYYRPKRRAREQIIKIGEIPAAELRNYRDKHLQDPLFVLPGGSPTSRYRAKSTFDTLSKWLRGKGFKGKTLHDLRKEAGSFVYRSTGSIDRTAQFLRNDSRTAREHYVDSTECIEVDYFSGNDLVQEEGGETVMAAQPEPDDCRGRADHRSLGGDL